MTINQLPHVNVFLSDSVFELRELGRKWETDSRSDWITNDIKETYARCARELRHAISRLVAVEGSDSQAQQAIASAFQAGWDAGFQEAQEPGIRPP